MAGAGHQAEAAAHHDAAAPDDQRLAVAVDVVIEPIFLAEEGDGVRVGIDVVVFQQRGAQRAHVAAGAEGLVAGAAQQHGHHGVVVLPGVQARVQQPYHLQRQRVQRFFRVQRGDGDALAAADRQFFKQYQVGHGGFVLG